MDKASETLYRLKPVTFKYVAIEEMLATGEFAVIRGQRQKGLVQHVFVRLTTAHNNSFESRRVRQRIQE
jgi:hypothetical protein